MRHYEIVFLVHPDQADQIDAMTKRYCSVVESDEGKIHRLEDWGMRKLAYPIKLAYKAHYILMNIECSEKVFVELQHIFRFNDAIIRYLIIKRDKAITEPSQLLNAEEDGEDAKPEAEYVPSPEIAADVPSEDTTATTQE